MRGARLGHGAPAHQACHGSGPGWRRAVPEPRPGGYARCMDPPAPLQLLTLSVEPDRAPDEFIDRLGMDAAYRARSQCSVFVLETHVTYQRELGPDDRMDVDLQLVDLDARRLHYFMRMHRKRDGELAATTEILLMHVDMRHTKGADMPEAVQEEARRLREAHARLPEPAELGRRIGIRRR